MKPLMNRCAALCVVCTTWILAVFCAAGCGTDRSAKTVMSEKLERAVQEAAAGQNFMASSLSGQTMTADEANAAKDYITQHADSSAYVLLMALREGQPQVYTGIPDKTKAKVFCDAIRRLTFLNDFGYMEPSESYDAEAAKALIKIGNPAIGCLSNLLADRSDAPLFGSQEATLSSSLHYRRADFAYRYIMLILGRKPDFPADPAERDKLIAGLQEDLEADSGR